MNMLFIVCLLMLAAMGSATSSLNFLMIGDWGWEGSFNASAVAHQMGVYAWRINAQFVLALGDNFYVDGVANTTDRLWTTAFHDIYTASSLQVPWYPILGNHDYHGNVQAQIDRSVEEGENIWKMPAKYYALTKTLAGGEIVSIINIDTAILEPGHDDTTSLLEDPEYLQKTADHLKWIDQTLEEHSKFATWVIVCGHYPIYSVGVNGDNTVLLSNLNPILQYHKVHMYVAGHDHNHQYISMPDGITHVIAGNGAGRGPFGAEGYKYLGISASTDYIENYFTDSGFAYATVDNEKFSTTFVDAKGGVHYTGVMTNPHTSEYRDSLAGVLNNNYHAHLKTFERDLEGYDFAAIMLPGFLVFALIAVYVFKEEPKVAAVLSTIAAVKSEAVHELKRVYSSSVGPAGGRRSDFRPDLDSSTRSVVGLTADMDRSGRRENTTIDRSMHV